MPGNDERDPLDSWLHQRLEPLPPPPGTFELITRRARRRKLRKLAVTVASAAAVAAAVAVAVPSVLALHVTPSRATASSMAGARPNSATGGAHPDGSATPSVAPTSSPSNPVSGPLEPSGPVPPNFQPASVTFVNSNIGWVIGQAGTPGHCADANPYICTSIVRTDDAGQTWHGGPAPKTGAPEGATGVSGIRFLDGVNGWAFGPELWATHDKGNTWHQVNTDGMRVTDLETVSGRAYALFAMCTTHYPYVGFAAGCTSFTLMTTTADSDTWTPVGGPTNGLTDGGNATSAMIALTSTAGYLLAPNGALYSGPLGSQWQQVGSVPCQPGVALGTGLPSRAMLALVDSTHLAIACAGTAGTQVYRSSDGGALWAPGPTLPVLGTPMSFTASLAGTLVLATTARTAILPAGATQWTVAKGTPLGGFSYVGMTTGTQGVAVAAYASNLHEIWMTFDGGQTWAPRTSITPPVSS